MNKKACILILLSMVCSAAVAQTTYLPLHNNDDYHLLDRVETRSGRFCDSLSLSNKPESRERAVEFLINQRENARYNELSAVDRYQMEQMVSENGEWAPGENGAINSEEPWFHTFYKKQYDFIHVQTHDFFLVVNPIISGQATYEHSNSYQAVGNPLLQNSHGLEVRGWIAKKVGFYTSITDNQEETPSYVTNSIESRTAVPGMDYYTKIGNAAGKYDYFQATGYFDFAVVKDHINVNFGYGKNFIGDGERSLFLSDNSSSYPFMKIITRIWKINYQNLYMELTPQYVRTSDRQLPHKYATMHTLSANVTKWLNVGFFEAVIFDRTNNYEIDYMNPIIFYRAVERFNGSPDNELLGFNFKAICLKHLQFYGQFLLDEFTSKQFFGNKGYWANKWGLQLGGKYFDAFTLKNLDLQAELNMVRPYTYSHSDTVANYTNYNQPLAHPLGSDFIEFIGIARYQPVKNLFLTLKGMYYVQGADSGKNAVNYGSNIFENYNTRPSQYGVGMINGVHTHCMAVNLNISYQLRPNLFIDVGGTQRNFSADNGNAYPIYNTTGKVSSAYSGSLIYVGIRLNAARRDYGFF